jgi:hypothetical protein
MFTVTPPAVPFTLSKPPFTILVLVETLAPVSTNRVPADTVFVPEKVEFDAVTFKVPAPLLVKFFDTLPVN